MKRATVLAKADRPETLAQAQTWQTIMHHAEAYGLCPRCAAQLAFGHQIGFSRVEHAPCPNCEPLIAALPKATSNPKWRTVDGHAKAPSSWPAARAIDGHPSSSGYLSDPRPPDDLK